MKKLIIILISVLLFFSSTVPVQAATLVAPKPSLSPGIYYTSSSKPVSLYAYPGETIVYTTNNTIPQASINWLTGTLSIQNGIKYTGTLYLTKTTTIRAIALKRYNTNSPVGVYKYEIYNTVTLDSSIRSKFSLFKYTSYPSTVYYTAADGTKGNLTKTYTGITPGTVNCTWYTFVHLKSMAGRDFLFNTAGGTNGKYWYPKAVATSYQIKYPGNTSLEALISANKNRPVYNIVVSFEKNGTGTAGHVMLIDAIINGKVYYSDNSAPGLLKTQSSIAAFKSAYYSYNGNIVGVVHIK